MSRREGSSSGYGTLKKHGKKTPKVNEERQCRGKYCEMLEASLHIYGLCNVNFSPPVMMMIMIMMMTITMTKNTSTNNI